MHEALRRTERELRRVSAEGVRLLARASDLTEQELELEAGAGEKEGAMARALRRLERCNAYLVAVSCEASKDRLAELEDLKTQQAARAGRRAGEEEPREDVGEEEEDRLQ